MPFGVLPREVYLEVHFSEKDDAKKLGARWDPSKKKWYVMNNHYNLHELEEKYKIKTDPIILSGEDRSYGGNELFIDLIPSTCWFKSARNYIHPRDWDRVRKYVYNRVNNICELCNTDTTKPVIPFIDFDKNTPVKIKNRNGQLVEGKVEDICGPDEYFIIYKDENGNEYPDFYKKNDIIIEPIIESIEAHERWHYDYNTNTQKLVRLVGLCKNCHIATHMGLAGLNRKDIEAFEHLKKVRNFTDEDASEHRKQASNLYKERSKIKWNLDLSLLTNNNIKYIADNT
tara:strand:- start:1333 stop:2190 length:858 start_codon:yes stop_codon:yes gene_type:complete